MLKTENVSSHMTNVHSQIKLTVAVHSSLPAEIHRTKPFKYVSTNINTSVFISSSRACVCVFAVNGILCSVFCPLWLESWSFLLQRFGTIPYFCFYLGGSDDLPCIHFYFTKQCCTHLMSKVVCICLISTCFNAAESSSFSESYDWLTVKLNFM